VTSEDDERDEQGDKGKLSEEMVMTMNFGGGGGNGAG
jgi:hypothetical protein